MGRVHIETEEVDSGLPTAPEKKRVTSTFRGVPLVDSWRFVQHLNLARAIPSFYW